jgi:formate dehydrogenase iron-sulfur subunit
MDIGPAGLSAGLDLNADTDLSAHGDLSASPDLSLGSGAPGLDPAARAGHRGHPPRVGFFTDTSVCIGCKACEVACKEWNAVPEDGLDLTGMSYDNTGGLSATTWRHVAFVEQIGRPGDGVPGGAAPGDGAAPGGAGPGGAGRDMPLPALPSGEAAPGDSRWLMSSDVCKHCTEAACLDVCPTGALMRTEFGTVVVQDDICNGCGYCVSACPFGVIARSETDGGAHKCTLCYDRLGDGLTPACAKACPTESIQFGPLDELREVAQQRVTDLQETGNAKARLYGENPADGVGGMGAFFLLLDEPEVYGLPPDPVVTTRDLPRMWRDVAQAAAGLLAAGLVSCLARRARTGSTS